jgi:hypothetical protein
MPSGAGSGDFAVFSMVGAKDEVFVAAVGAGSAARNSWMARGVVIASRMMEKVVHDSVADGHVWFARLIRCSKILLAPVYSSLN